MGVDSTQDLEQTIFVSDRNYIVVPCKDRPYKDDPDIKNLSTLSHETYEVWTNRPNYGLYKVYYKERAIGYCNIGSLNQSLEIPESVNKKNKAAQIAESARKPITEFYEFCTSKRTKNSADYPILWGTPFILSNEYADYLPDLYKIILKIHKGYVQSNIPYKCTKDDSNQIISEVMIFFSPPCDKDLKTQALEQLRLEFQKCSLLSLKKAYTMEYSDRKAIDSNHKRSTLCNLDTNFDTKAYNSNQSTQETFNDLPNKSYIEGVQYYGILPYYCYCEKDVTDLTEWINSGTGSQINQFKGRRVYYARF